MDKSPGSATQRAYDFIRRRLKNREDEPGTRLVTRSLANALGTSLNPIREALNRLSSQGLVDHIPGAGTFVPRPDSRSIRDLYGLREAIECFAAVEAIDHINADELATLKKLCTDWKAQAERMKAEGIPRLNPHELDVWAAQEELFHRTIVDAARNKMLSDIVEEKSVLARMFAGLNELNYDVTVATIEQVVETHSALIASIETCDRASAREQTSAMLRHGRDCVLENRGSVPH